MPPLSELDPLAATAAFGCAVFGTLIADLVIDYVIALLELP